MRHRGLALAVLAFATFLDLMDITIVNVALPAIQSDLSASPAQLEWVVGGYTLAFAALLITAGRLGDRYGRRTVFVAGVLVFTAASAMCGLAPSGALLVAARVVQGIGAALMVPQLLSSIQAMYSPRERAPIFGLVGAISGLAAVAGPLLGGWLVTGDPLGIGWRAVFLINLPTGVVIAIAAMRFVPNTRAAQTQRLDPVGVGLATLGVLLLVLPLVEGRSLGWPAWTWLLIAGSPVVLGFFVLRSRRQEGAGDDPLIPMRLFGDRGFSAGVITQACFQAGMAGFFLVLAIYLQRGLGFTAMESGFTLVPFTVGAFLGSGVAVPLGRGVGKLITFSGAVLMAGGTGWAGSAIGSSGPTLSGWDLALPLGLAGLGLGLLVVPLIDIALATVPIDDAGAASGSYSTFQQAGAALGVAVVGAVFFDLAGEYSQPDLQSAIGPAIWVVVGLFATCALVSLALPTRTRVRAHAQELDALAASESDSAAAVWLY